MARGRFLSRSISESDKLAGVSERAALLWFLSLAHHDVDGLLEGRPGKALRIYGGAAAESWGWERETIEVARAELERVGLWIDRGNDVVEVADHKKHNELRRDREPASHLAERIGVADTTTSEQFRRHSGNNAALDPTLRSVTPAEVQVQVQVQVQDDDDDRRCAPSSSSSTKVDTEEPTPPKPWKDDPANVLLRAWRDMHRQVNADRTPETRVPVPNSSILAAEEAYAHNGENIDLYLHNPDGLIREVMRLCRCFQERSWRVTFKGVCKMIGHVMDDTTTPDPIGWTLTPPVNGKPTVNPEILNLVAIKEMP